MAMKLATEQDEGEASEVATTSPARTNPTRTEILGAAARLIVDHGYGACTMRAVAERVNLKAGSIYYHFASKGEIVVEIMNAGVVMLLDEVKRKLDELPPQSSFNDRISTAVHAHIACKVNRDVAYMQVYEHLPPVVKRKSRGMRQAYAELWVRLFQDGMASGHVDPALDLSIFVPYFLGGLNRVQEWFRRGKSESGDVAAIAVSTLLRGISTPVLPKAPVRKAARRAIAD